MSSFAEKLKTAMTERNMNQTELSACSGISKSSISQYLSGKFIPNAKGKEKLATALEVTTDFFEEKAVYSDKEYGQPRLRNVTIAQCADLLGKSRQFVRVSLQRGAAPFGYAVKVTGGKWSYHISPKKLNEYIGGVDEAISIPAADS